MTVAWLGNKIFFAGGSKYDFVDDDDWGEATSRVDIYDAVSNTWSIAELSKPRNRLVAATIGNNFLCRRENDGT
jgi:Kelch motif